MPLDGLIFMGAALWLLAVLCVAAGESFRLELLWWSIAILVTVTGLVCSLYGLHSPADRAIIIYTWFGFHALCNLGLLATLFLAVR